MKTRARKFVSEYIHPAIRTLRIIPSHESVNLLLGTAAVESHFKYTTQLSGGPAKGYWQMEPRTFNDILINYVKYRPWLRDSLRGYKLSPDTLESDPVFAAILARIHYLRIKTPIPLTIPGQAAYWKHYYNTYLGAGTVDKYLEAWEALVE